MGLFDDMTAILGRGMDAADKKTQEIKLQSELNRMAASKEKALAELGRAVLTQEGADPSFVAAFADQVMAIGDLEAQEEGLKQQLEALRSSGTLVNGAAMQTASAIVQGQACPACGTPVTLEAMFCPGCGDNLAALKAQYRRCPSCNVYYTADSSFCERCGSRTVELEVARVAGPVSQPDYAAVDEAASELQMDELLRGPFEAGAAVCPNCGEAIKPGNTFCGNCGERL